MPTVNANGINIYYEVHGEGQPLLLITGLSYTHWAWHRMVPYLAENFQVIVFDNRGAGQTDKPEGPYNVEMMAADTAGLLEALGIEQAAAMGHSLGGFVAQALVLARPELVSKLILAGTSFGGPNAVPITPEALAVLTDPSIDSAELTRRGLHIATAPGFAERNPAFVEKWLAHRTQKPMAPEHYQAQLAVSLALASEEAAFEKHLPQLATPTLLLFGEHDKLMPPGNAELLAEKIPNSTVVILPDAGHQFPLEIPEEAARAVTTFLTAS